MIKVRDKVDLLSCYEESPRGGVVLEVAAKSALVRWKEGCGSEWVNIEDLAVTPKHHT